MKSLSIIDDIEDFISNAEIIMFKSEGETTVMNIIFGKSKFKVFKSLKRHQTLRSYFKDRTVKMIINFKDDKNTCSLIDINTADCLNIKKVKFVAGNLEEFLGRVPEDRKIALFIWGLSKDGETMVSAPLDPNKELTQIYGYSVK